MSYKINPAATTTTPGNLTAAEKVKLTDLPSYDTTSDYLTIPSKNILLYHSSTDNCNSMTLPAITAGWAPGTLGLLTNGIAASNPAMITINLNKFIGATLASVKMFYQVNHTTVPATQVISFEMYKRAKTSNTAQQIINTTNISYASTLLSNITGTPGTSETIAADTVYYIILNNETGTNAAAGQRIYGFELAINGITKIYQLNHE